MAAVQTLLRRYGVATTINFPLTDAGTLNFANTGDFTPVAADTQISKDEAAFANTGSTPAPEGQGMWSLALTATEMQAARIMITVVDAATKAVEDQAIVIETYGNLLAQQNFSLHLQGTADSGTSTTMVDASRTEASSEFFRGMGIYFTSGNNAGVARRITAFVPGSDTIQFSPALELTVASGDDYEIFPWAQVDVGAWLVTAVATPTVAGVPEVDVTHIRGGLVPATAATGVPDVNVTHQGGGVIPAPAVTGVPDVNVTHLEDSTTITLPGQEAPPLAPSLPQLLGWLYKVFRNRKTQTATLWQLMADNETTVDAKATVSDDATTAIKQEIVSGP